jgi:tetratricopeptide (TPR) repeat protein
MAVAQGEEDKGEAVARSSAAARLAARRAAKAAAKASKRGTAPIMPSRVARGLGATRSFYQQNQRPMVVGLSAASLLAALWLGLQTHVGKRGREAAELLGTGVATANAPIVAPGDEPQGQTPEESYPSPKARAEKARGEYEAMIKRFPDATATAWARLGEANEQSALGQPANAQKLYAQVLADKDIDPFLRWRALEGIGFALEAQQKYSEAADRFGQIGALESGAYKAVADYHKARMLIALGQKQKAAELLQALVKAERARPPGEGMRFDDLVTEADTRLTELSVELNAPKLRVDLPASAKVGAAAGPSPGGGGPSPAGTGLTKDIVDALRKQLASGKGGKGLTKEIIDQLDKQVKSGNTSATSVRVPAPKPGDKPK